MNYLRIFGIVGLFWVIGFACWHVKSKFDQLDASEKVQAGQLATITAQNEVLKKNQLNVQIGNEVSGEYEKKIADLYSADAVSLSAASDATGHSLPGISSTTSGFNAAACGNASADRRALKLALKKEILKLTYLQDFNRKTALNMSK